PLPRVEGMASRESVHEALGRVREPPGLVLRPVVARPLTPPDQRVEGGKEVQGDEDRAPPEQLAVVDPAPARECLLQLPGSAHASVVVRAAGPARIGAPDDRLPEAGDPFGKAVEGRADADCLDEGAGVSLVTEAPGGEPAELAVAVGLELSPGGELPPRPRGGADPRRHPQRSPRSSIPALPTS